MKGNNRTNHLPGQTVEILSLLMYDRVKESYTLPISTQSNILEPIIMHR